ncbi:MAG: tRNA (guanosine(46)-N7)-methyltransferase TrmB [candidate division WOR-3 bacterium]
MGDKEPIDWPIFDPFKAKRPFVLSALFGRDAPLELEIGFGRGDFLVQRAGERPDLNILGLEVSSLSVLKASKRLARAGIRNVRIAKIDAASALFYFLPARSISRTWVLFPEPWPKARHEHRRLLSSGFFKLLSARTVDGGEALVATDWPDYRDWVISEAVVSGAFELESETWPVPMTKYHEKWRAKGRAIYPLLFRKRSEPDVSGLFPAEIEMSQIKMRAPKDLASVVRDFSPVMEKHECSVVRVMKAYLSQDGQEALFLCLVSERGFLQRFLTSARLVGDTVLVKPHDHTHLVITPGVKRCLEQVARITGVIEIAPHDIL